MPVGINSLTEGWLELESDPGLFTLLLEDFGVNGVQVEEIYDLQKRIEGHVYGFIFLFRWIDDRRRRRNIVEQTETFVKDEDVVNNIFFAQQIVPNSCATHALLSVLLNCPNIHLGDTLSRLKAHTTGMCPENKGWAIGNTPELAKAHNSHAMPQARRCVDKSLNVATAGATGGRYTGETYHFVSYVPIQGKLFELDGLKPFPMDHGPWGESESWTEKFRRVIMDRLGSAQREQSHDIRFNLMAVVPDRRIALTRRLTNLKTNKQIASEAFQQVVRNSQAKAKEETETPEKKDSEIKIENQENTADKEPSGGDDKSEISTDPQYFLQKPILETRSLTKIQLVGMPDIDPGPDKGSQSSLDYSMPLTVQTSPVPSCSSTDTSSEVGSAFNSPTQGWGWNSGQNSPMSSKDLKKLVVVRVSTSESDSAQSNNRKRDSSDTLNFSNKKSVLETSSQSENSNPENTPSSDKKAESKIHCKLFASPSDYIVFLRNLESEIRACEANLRDENEKRKQYKIDDCRRTHNYDEFICTFLSMLAQQGKLADLVQQQLSGTKISVPVPKVPTVMKKPTPPHTTPRRRRARAKCRRRK